MALQLYAWDHVPGGFNNISVYVLAEDEEHAWRVFQEQSHSLWWKCWKGMRVGDTDVAIRPRRVESPGIFVVHDNEGD
jgi:hypothetical protein